MYKCVSNIFDMFDQTTCESAFSLWKIIKPKYQSTIMGLHLETFWELASVAIGQNIKTLQETIQSE